MRKSSLLSRLVGCLLFATLLPVGGDVPLLPVAARAASQAAPKAGSACDAIRAKIKRVTLQLRRAVASGRTALAKRLRRQLRTLRRQLAICQATPPPPFIEMVTVGNAGNAPDSTSYGAVPYEFKIGKFEVTLTQYAAFLNAVSATDPYDLFHPGMATDMNIAGIARSGTTGNFAYSVIGTGARPVTYVNWFDAARFCNWLHNGRPSGAQTAATTENGAYPLNGLTSGGLTITRNPGAKFWIPSEDEWYKAAYHQPKDQGGDGDDYWLYATRSNVVPGNKIGPLPLMNHANCLTSVYSVTQSPSYSDSQNYLTTAGSYPGSSSFYGTFDQGGNVWEWTEVATGGLFRPFRGGSWSNDTTALDASSRLLSDPAGQSDVFGFRVAGP